jgi:hypothetical protein
MDDTEAQSLKGGTMERESKQYEDKQYEKPHIADHGDLTELTTGLKSGSQLDAAFPVGTPSSHLTFTTPTP